MKEIKNILPHDTTLIGKKYVYDHSIYNEGDFSIDENGVKWVCVDVKPITENDILKVVYEFEKEEVK